ncbi:hypothetical protein BpHYR1_022667 [Brachionus plicatilis]|uniref:Uncharacterized protein n=1 Tax=Brachionus plicatilis TaxID=10195 RepID=A0A3M7SJN1_BRAPC|nr:hypothetical protein BpHYR1_022667 [Brachionus plicatilis]
MEKFAFSQVKQARNEPFNGFVNRIMVMNSRYKDANAEKKSRIIKGCYSEANEGIWNQSSAIVEDRMKIIGAVASKHTEAKFAGRKCHYWGRIMNCVPKTAPRKGFEIELDIDKTVNPVL